MKTCKDCIHDKLCDEWAVTSGIPFVNADTCEHYKNKADFVEVVRCVECRYASKCTDGYYACKVDHRLAHDENDFCSYGERKRNEQAD